MPRHPPFALNNLTTENKDARVHCAILNQRPTHNPNCHPPNLGAVTGFHKRYRQPDHAWQFRKTQPHYRVVPSGPNRVLIIPTSRTNPTPPHHPHKEGGGTRQGQPLPIETPPVSPPTSTPTQHPQAAGSSTPFGVRCSLERR